MNWALQLIHLNFIYECGMDQKYMFFGIKNNSKLCMIYDVYIAYT